MKKAKQFLKNKRYRQYEEINEEMANVGLNLSEIKVEDFIESRKKELTKFQDILKHKFSTKHGHQLLPHHMRRRQMSHNPFRIPRSHRVSNLTVNVKSKCRKHKRKLINMKKSLIRRARRQNWLEGHLWLAKRFVMKKYLNTYTIPYKRRDKGYRACYKYWEYYSIIHDMSYYNYFVINVKNGKEKNFIEILLKKYSVGNDINNFNQEIKLYNIIVYDNNGRLIGPIEFFYYKNIFIILNICIITEEIYTLLNNILKELNNDIDIKFSHKFNLFLLGGKTCLSKIISVLSESNIDINIENINYNEGLINHILKSDDGEIITFKIKQPQSICRLNELIYKKTLNENINKDELINNLYINSSIKETKINKEFINLFNSETNLIDYITYKKKYLENDTNDIAINKDKNNVDEYDFNFSKITERTTYMHRKKVDIKNLNKVLSDSIKQFKKNGKTEPILTQAKKGTEEKYIKGKIYKKEEIKDNILSSNDKETYICLIKKNIYYYDYNSQLKINPIYYIIFPRGYSIDLIRRFTYINTKAIGLKDLERFRTQYDQLNFPKDYPGCASYEKYMLNKTKRVLVKYYKKPPSKRVNYLKILNPSPFYPCWNRFFEKIDEKNFDKNKSNIFNSLNNINIIPSIRHLGNKNYLNELINITKNNGNNFLLNIEITTVFGGIPKYNDLLYIPNEDDINKYLSHIKAKENINNLLFKDIEENQDEDKNNIIMEDVGVYINEYDKIRNNFKIIEEIKDNNISYGFMSKNKYFNDELLNLMKYYNKLNSNDDTDKEFYSNIINTDLTIKLKCKLSRNLIGFITTGLYDYSINKGKGTGFIKVKEYQLLYSLKQKYNLEFMPILLRKKNSLVYYLCKLSFH